jgi:hypothetical protein
MRGVAGRIYVELVGIIQCRGEKQLAIRRGRKERSVLIRNLVARMLIAASG